MAKKSVNFAKGQVVSAEIWKIAKAKVKENEGKHGMPEFADDKYTARLVGADIGKSSSGNNQIAWKFKFVDGPYKGQIKTDYTQLATDQNIYYLGVRIEQFGYEMPDDQKELKDVLAAIASDKSVCNIRLRTKGEFQNVFVDQVFGEDDEEEIDEEENDSEEEETEEGTEEEVEEETEEEESEEEVEEEAEEESEEEEEESEEEVEEADEETADLQVGQNVAVETSKGEIKGEVIQILEDEGKARVKTAEGKVLKVAFDKIVIDSAVPEEPKTKKSTAKKTESETPKQVVSTASKKTKK